MSDHLHCSMLCQGLIRTCFTSTCRALCCLQDFLKRAELREYEIERDKRLASDVRLRGRL